MKSHYKRIGNFVTKIKKKNFDNALSAKDLKGININKYFMPSVANINGTDLSKYRIVSKRQFSFNPMHVGRDEVLPIAIHKQDKPIIVSPAYVVFEIKNTEILSPEYLMMWCSRLDFDRKALFMTDNSIRGNLSWEDFCDIELPVPPIEKQREIVREYNTVNDRIKLNEKITQKLEETAQAIYKQWFVDFEFPITKEYSESIGNPELEGKPYKSSGGKMVYCDELDKDIPIGWEHGKLDNLVYFQNGYGFKSDVLINSPNNLNKHCYSVFKMGNIKKGGGINLENTKSWVAKSNCDSLKSFIIKKNDLLMAMTDMKESIGLLGNTALMVINNKFILNQRVALIRPSNKVGIGYATLYCLTNSSIFLQELRSRANIGVQVNLTKPVILSSKMLIANKAINEKLEFMLQKYIKWLYKIEIEKTILNRLLCTLLNKLSWI